MVSENKTDRKITLEREYVVPLRKEWLKAPYYRRAKKAVKALKEFLVKHMKIYDRDLRKVKVDIYLNNEMRFRGMKYPPAKIKIKAIKYDDGIVEAKLVQLPKHIEFELARNIRKEAEITKKQGEAEKKEAKEEKPEATPEEKKETSSDKKAEKEKETSSKEAEQQLDKAKAKEAKHSTGGSKKEPEIKRKVLNR